MKSNVSKFLIIFVLLVSVYWIRKEFFLVEDSTPIIADETSNIGAIQTDKQNFLNAETGAEMNTKKISAAKSKSVLPTPDDIEKRFSDPDPDNEDLIAKLETLLAQKGNDSTGTTDIKIAKILGYCNGAPKNEKDLKQQTQIFENFASDNGRDNGQIQSGLAAIERDYSLCQEASRLVSGKTDYDFYKNAVDAGHPFAKVTLATEVLPPNFSSYSEEQKKTYQEDMGLLLYEARSQCEPTAFLAFGFEHDTLEEFKIWSHPNDELPAISQYGNFIAYAFFYENKVSGSEDVATRYVDEAKNRYENLSSYDVEEAKKYGADLFRRYCEK